MSVDMADPGSTVSRLVVAEVDKVFPAGRRSAGGVQALSQVSLTIEPGESVGLVGASGSGKTTLARLITGVGRPSAGTITFGSLRVDRLRRRQLRSYRREVQLVFQDPYAALNPVHTVGYTLSRPLVNFLGTDPREVRRLVLRLLDSVGLTPVEQFIEKMPHQLSGGQRQRVVIARALASEPKLLIADEPVSMLDVSLRAGILSLLADRRRDRGISLLYITHDLLSARVVTDRLVVLNQGQVVETGATVEVLQHPRHPYTRQLLAALPNPFVSKAGPGLPEDG
ncbi:MAG: ABC transporter ATP-binding protein [Candidatus Dormibacteria bacterium]